MRKRGLFFAAIATVVLGGCAGMHPHDAGGYLGAAIGASIAEQNPAVGAAVGHVGGRVAGQAYCALNPGDVACRRAGEPYRASAGQPSTWAQGANPA